MRAEIMPPLADAMRLVNHYERDLGLTDELLKLRRIATLGRDVNQLVQTAFDLAEASPNFRRRKRAVQVSDIFEAAPRHPVNLILHQRDQRGNHQRQSAHQLCGQLVAERFAKAGRQHSERVAMSQRVFDHLALVRAEPLETEMFAQRAFKFVYFHGGWWRKDIELAIRGSRKREYGRDKNDGTNGNEPEPI